MYDPQFDPLFYSFYPQSLIGYLQAELFFFFFQAILSQPPHPPETLLLSQLVLRSLVPFSASRRSPCLHFGAMSLFTVYIFLRLFLFNLSFFFSKVLRTFSRRHCIVLFLNSFPTRLGKPLLHFPHSVNRSRVVVWSLISSSLFLPSCPSSRSC